MVARMQMACLTTKDEDFLDHFESSVPGVPVFIITRMTACL